MYNIYHGWQKLVEGLEVALSIIIVKGVEPKVRTQESVLAFKYSPTAITGNSLPSNCFVEDILNLNQMCTCRRAVKKYSLFITNHSLQVPFVLSSLAGSSFFFSFSIINTHTHFYMLAFNELSLSIALLQPVYFSGSSTLTTDYIIGISQDPAMILITKNEDL